MLRLSPSFFPFAIFIRGTLCVKINLLIRKSHHTIFVFSIPLPNNFLNFFRKCRHRTFSFIIDFIQMFDKAPRLGYVVTGTLTLKDQIYMRPRMSDTVARTTS